MRLFGAILGFFAVDFLFHLIDALAVGMKAETGVERIGAVGVGVIVLLLLIVLFYRFFSKSFFHGFIVATGLFLSFDIVVFHWIFQLHRITSGPEANWLEPIFVVTGTILVIYGIKKEKTITLTNDKEIGL
jgi:hypothetical protein